MTTSLRLDANLRWLFTELPFEKRFAAAADAGFAAVEYPFPYPYPPALLRKYLADSGLKQILINTPVGESDSPSFAGMACIPGHGREFRDGLLRALEYADQLNAEVVHVMGGSRPPDVSRDTALATYVKNIAWAVEQAASTNVTLALESINKRDSPRHILDSVDHAASVVSALGSSRLGVLFDVFHCQVDSGNVTTRLREMMPLIAHVQIADVPNRHEPGTGEIAWPYVFDQLRALEYRGWIGLEYQPTDTTIKGLTWRDKLIP